MQVIVGDYSSQQESWLRELEKISQARGDEGLLHSGAILWIQGYLQERFGFMLKAAIAPILDAVPTVFSKDLPQQLEQKETMKASDEQIRFCKQLNENLILPIDLMDIVRVIIAGQAYEANE